jgi:hypothetical protein
MASGRSYAAVSFRLGFEHGGLRRPQAGLDSYLFYAWGVRGVVSCLQHPYIIDRMALLYY